MKLLHHFRISALLVLGALSLSTRSSYAQNADQTAPLNDVHDEKEQEKLAGTWKVVSVRTVGVPRPFSRQDFSKSEAEFEKATCRIAADTIRIDVGNEVREAKFTVSADKSPKTIDINAQLFPYYQKGVASLAIYELKADRLKICFGPGKSARPKAFEPNDKDGQLFVFLIEFQREEN